MFNKIYILNKETDINDVNCTYKSDDTNMFQSGYSFNSFIKVKDTKRLLNCA